MTEVMFLCLYFSVLISVFTDGKEGLTFNAQPFKRQVSAVVRALFTLNPHCGKVFSLLNDNGIHLMGQN
jgi:hypothetical protein